MVTRLILALTVSLCLVGGVSPTQARSYPCWVVRMYVATHTSAELAAREKEYHVTKDEKAAAIACLPKRKHK